MKVVAVIPCHNEAEHITNVVVETRKCVDEVLVAAGRSTDNTRAVAINAGAKAVLPGVDYVQGYGFNVKSGVICAIKDSHADVLVLLDGDGQHDPSEIAQLLKPILSNKADAVMGCRIIGEEMPRYRRFGNKVLSFICNTGSSFYPPDAVTGFWAIKTESFPVLKETGWGLAIELLIKLRRNGSRLSWVPVRAIYHDKYSDNSLVSPLRLGLALLWAICKWRVKEKC